MLLDGLSPLNYFSLIFSVSCHVLTLFLSIFVVAFVKGDYPKQFPGLEVRYIRGSDPFIKLLNDQRDVVETLSIDRWDTDAIVEFLNERLEK